METLKRSKEERGEVLPGSRHGKHSAVSITAHKQANGVDKREPITFLDAFLF